MLRIRISRNRVAKNQSKSWKISTKINENHKNIIRFFKTIKLMFTDKYLPHKYQLGHISEKYIFFYRKKSKTKGDIFPILGRIWSRIRIRYFTKRIRGSGSGSIWAQCQQTQPLFIVYLRSSSTALGHSRFKVSKHNPST